MTERPRVAGAKMPAVAANGRSAETFQVVADATPADEESGVWPDDAAESAFLAEARERGEPVVAAKPPADVVEEPENKTLPTLDELVQRIPADVRETLEDLFRARFVTVKRVPKKALKT